MAASILQSHTLLFDTYENKPPAEYLPRMPNEDSYIALFLQVALPLVKTRESENR